MKLRVKWWWENGKQKHTRDSIVAHINFEWGYVNGLFKESSGNAEPS